MNDISFFLNKENVKTLWEVISDEEIFKFLPKDIQKSIFSLFFTNIRSFYENEKNNSISLINLNKKYIFIILNHIKKTYPYNPSKIKIAEELPNANIIKYEECEKYDNSNTREKKQTIQSIQSDYRDEPIKDISLVLKELINQRNYVGITDFDNTNTYLHGSSSLSSTKKNVSWNDDIEEKQEVEKKEEEEEEEENIFSKLKKVSKISKTTKVDTEMDKNDLEIDELNIMKDVDIEMNGIKKEKENKQNEEKINKLENEIHLIHFKLDTIMNLLQNK